MSGSDVLNAFKGLFPEHTVTIRAQHGSHGFVPDEPKGRVFVLDNRECVSPIKAQLEYWKQRAVCAENAAEELRKDFKNFSGRVRRLYNPHARIE